MFILKALHEKWHQLIFSLLPKNKKRFMTLIPHIFNISTQQLFKRH